MNICAGGDSVKLIANKHRMPISATMAAALGTAIEHGGTLERLAGGFWTYPGAPRAINGVPDWYVGGQTVNALVARERLKFTQWKVGRGFTFPIAAEVVAENV